jgi:hypothetical protein
MVPQRRRLPTGQARHTEAVAARPPAPVNLRRELADSAVTQISLDARLGMLYNAAPSSPT